jgi:hypothetical protein
MSPLEDQLRDLMTERAARPPAQPEPYEGVHRLIRRTHRRRAAAGAAGLAAVALVAVAVALPDGGQRSGHVASPSPTAGALPVTIVPRDAEQGGAVGVTVPADGLTFVVDCFGRADTLLIRVNSHWFSAFNCGGPGADVPTSLALRPADYRRFELQVGSLVTVAAKDLAGAGVEFGRKDPWQVRVRAGVAAVTAPVVPEPTRLPGRRPLDAIASFSPSVESPNAETAGTFTVPRGGVDIVVSCLYPGTVAFEVRDAAGQQIMATEEQCTNVLGPNDEALPIARDTVLPSNAGPQRITVRVTTTGFTHPTWRVDLVPPKP